MSTYRKTTGRLSRRARPKGSGRELAHMPSTGAMPAEASASLSVAQTAFILEYEANGRNATRAYLRAHPRCRSNAAAAVEGCRTLRNPNVAKALDEIRSDRAKRLSMAADEAAMRVAICARANIRNAYDNDGILLPVHEWPDVLALAVKAVKPDGTIILHDALKACITILQMHGKLRPTVDVNHFDHVGYLAGKARARLAAERAEHGA